MASVVTPVSSGFPVSKLVNSPETQRIGWFVPGDLNGFFGLVVDNLSVLGFMAFILTGPFEFPADVVFERMFPGTAFGVLFGDLVYTIMARRLARKLGREVTAMPLGLDTPSSIGMALLVLGPAFLAFKAQGLDPHAAAIATWHLGMASMVTMGVLKLGLAFIGPKIQTWVPRAGLLGSIAAIAIALIGFIPLLDILKIPVVGFLALGIVLYSVVAHGRLPGKLPGVLAAFAVGTAVYYLFGPLGWLGPGYHAPQPFTFRFALPIPTLGFIDGLQPSFQYLPLVLPFGLLTVVGGINVCESARAAGDDFSTRDILVTEALSTLAAGVCGGVAQTTPYIGQPAYKHMGARVGYTLLTGVFVGLGGLLGYLANIVEWLPLPVLAPILIFVSLDITVQAFHATPERHGAAVAFAFFPSIARMLAIKLSIFLPPAMFGQLLSSGERGLPDLGIIVALGNGFIITSMIWAAFVTEMIDRRLRVAAGYLTIGGLLSLFGIIHSVEAGGGMYRLWKLDGVARTMATQFTAAYFVLAAAIFIFSLLPSRTDENHAKGGH